MTRQIRWVGTNSGDNGCPSLYELDNDRYLVQGTTVTDPGELAQLRRLAADESAVIVPRELLANFGPREPVHVPQQITIDQFNGMFSRMLHSAWRLETRRRYASDEDTETYAQFARGDEVRWDMDSPWCVGRREQAALGKRYERVRLIDTPATMGQRYLLDNARRNAAVGEDIRMLGRTQADELQLPAEDFWIFDSRVVALIRFDEHDVITHVELITNPVDVLRYCQVRDAAWHYAVPHEDYHAVVSGA